MVMCLSVHLAELHSLGLHVYGQLLLERNAQGLGNTLHNDASA